MRTIKSNLIIVAATFIVLLIAGIALVMITPEKEKFKKNVEFSFLNISYSKEKISCYITINNILFMEAADISTMKDTLIGLGKGLHKIEVSTINGKFKNIDTIKVENNKKNYVTIRYVYQPDYSEYLPVFKERYFSRLTKKEYTKEQNNTIRKQIVENITIEKLKNHYKYKPVDRKFEIEIKDFKYLLSKNQTTTCRRSLNNHL